MFNPHLYLWAKLGKATWPDAYHPLLFHLIDVAVVARAVWEEVLRPPVRQRFAAAVGLPVEVCAPWVAFWVGAHDIGKCSPGFQSQGKTETLKQHLKQRRFDFNQTSSTPHATVSVPLLRGFLCGRLGVTETLARRVALAVGGHHGTVPEVGVCDDLVDTSDVGLCQWPECQYELLELLAELLDVPCNKPPSGGVGEDQSYLMVLAGLTAVADWIGSNKSSFPEKGNATNWQDQGEAAERRCRDYVTWASKQASESLRKLGWSGRENASLKRPAFRDLFGYLGLKEIRPLQEKAEELAGMADGPSLVLVESPMGEGKTEAALCLADAWERRGGQGMYVALPTMATSNGMFGRVEKFLDANYPGRKQLHLLHGHSLLSEAYERLQDNAKAIGFNAELFDEDKHPSAVVADAWFAHDKKQGLLAPFAVGTIDQALLAVLQTKHMFVRLFGLAGKTVILDEVHAYDAYMTTLLERLLEWLSALGCPVVLLSATLPRAKRLALLRAYAGKSVEVGNEQDYPRITVVQPGSALTRTEYVPASAHKSLRLEWHEADLDRLAEELTQALADGGCAAVIRNTVGLAQQTYAALKARLPADVEVELFHARFLFADRQRIERRVVERYGKETPNRPRKAVLCASQVIEQSLDLDFDLLLSDLAPVDLVLQRAGRLWRHDRKRPARLTEPVVWLLTPASTPDGLPDLGVHALIYDRCILLRSFLALRGRTNVELPEDMEGLIEAVYGQPPLTPPPKGPWANALIEAEKEMLEDEHAYKAWADEFRIGEPISEDELLFRSSSELEEDNPTAPKCRQAATRLVEPTVALVILYELNGRLFLDASAQHPVSLNRLPSDERQL